MLSIDLVAISFYPQRVLLNFGKNIRGFLRIPVEIHYPCHIYLRETKTIPIPPKAVVRYSLGVIEARDLHCKLDLETIF